jgi:signal peptidase II
LELQLQISIPKENMTLFLKRIWMVLCVISLCVGCDQGTKRLAELKLKGHPQISYMADSVKLIYSENSGAWGGLGSSWPQPIKAFVHVVLPAAVMLSLLLLVLFKASVTTVEILSYSLIIGGGIGNVIDRILYGYVVDFMYMGIGDIGTNIFNVADFVIMFGIFVLVIDNLSNRLSFRRQT